MADLMKKYKPYFFPFLLILLCFLTHVFTYRWELPAWSEHVADSAYPNITATVKDMFRAKTAVYPPLQFIIYDLLSPGWTGDIASCPDPLALQSARIASFRIIAAIMLTGIVLLLYGFSRIILKRDRWTSFAAGVLCALLPVNLYYSHTSNMDIPYTFWYMTAVFCGCMGWKTEEQSRRHSLVWNLLCGVAIACSFCTKDQSGALLVLPAFLYMFFRYRAKKNIAAAIRPVFFWGLAFVPVTLLIYLRSVGLPDALNHFSYIFSDGKDDFLAVKPGLPGFMQLIADSFRHLAIILDYPVLLILIAALAAGWKNAAGCLKKYRTAFLFLTATILSLFFFFTLPILRSEVRWFVPLCPWFCLTLAIWIRETCSRKTALILYTVLFLLQGVMTIQFLYMLNHTPLRTFRDHVKQELTAKGHLLSVPTASIGKFYYFRSGQFQTKKAVRNWAVASYALEGCRHAEIYPDLSACIWTGGDYLALNGSNRNDTNFMQEIQPYYTKVRSFESRIILPYLFPFKPETVDLYQRTKEFTTLRNSRFAAMPRNEQLMLLTFYLKNAPLSSVKAKNMILDVLQKDQQFDPEQYHISTEVIKFITTDTPQ
ncbi:MAG: glycosyltransferase family 39 protein [Lentisphaeria bacterium]|nr:glycosyltransferase family 39 protein [Lentisphaeria bacterium]